MPHYEVVFEDGTHSVACYENDEEALSAAKAHHERATKGQTAMPDTRVPAVRVVKVLKYDAPPGDLMEAQMLPKDQLQSELNKLIEGSTKNGVTDLAALAAGVRNLSNPFDEAAGPHDSKYRAKESQELELSWL